MPNVNRIRSIVGIASEGFIIGFKDKEKDIYSIFDIFVRISFGYGKDSSQSLITFFDIR